MLGFIPLLPALLEPPGMLGKGGNSREGGKFQQDPCAERSPAKEKLLLPSGEPNLALEGKFSLLDVSEG